MYVYEVYYYISRFNQLHTPNQLSEEKDDAINYGSRPFA